MKTFLFASLCLVSVFLNAQKKLEIQFLEQSISVDGKLDETIWESLPGYSNFYNYLPTDKGLAKNQTEFKLFHNGEFLFVSAVYQDTTSTVLLRSLKRDDFGITVAESETFVFIMDTQTSALNLGPAIGGERVFGDRAFGFIGYNSWVDGAKNLISNWNGNNSKFEQIGRASC